LQGRPGWKLPPAYDLNPVPTDIKARVLTTNINLDDATYSLSLVEEAADYFSLALKDARAIIKEVASATAKWRLIAQELGVRPAEGSRMSSAFEHDDAARALAL
jgi:serine/threonine-protein kinase HipA